MKNRRVLRLIAHMTFLLSIIFGTALCAVAEDRDIPLVITWDKPNASRGDLVRAVGDEGDWTFRIVLDGVQLKKPPEPTWNPQRKKADGTAGNWGSWIPAADNMSLLFSSPDEPGGTFTTTVSGKIKRIKTGTGGPGQPGAVEEEKEFFATWSGELSDIAVEFERDLIRTGFALTNDVPDPNSLIGKVTVAATVTPKEQTNNITIVPGEGEGIANRISITNIVKDAATGKITFDLRGTSASKDRNGDSLIAAKKIDDGKLVGTAKVVVIVPKKAGEPFPQVLGPQATIVTAQNMGLNSFTTPAQYEEDENDGTITVIPKTKYWLYTLYKHLQTIHVVDQFGLPLDSLYAGVEVEETHPINQTLSAQGTYQDPVSIFFLKPAPNIADSPNQATNDEIKRKWEAKEGADNQPVPLSSLPIVDRDQVVPNFVVIAGHVFYIKRRIVVTPGNPNANPPIPDRLRIEWIPVQEREDDE